MSVYITFVLRFKCGLHPPTADVTHHYYTAQLLTKVRENCTLILDFRFDSQGKIILCHQTLFAISSTSTTKTSRFGGRVHTRFPPEPNGYLHIGHAKSVCLNFGIAAEYKGLCNLRFDDTNPTKEEVEYVESIIEDVRWLGFDLEDRLFYASDYFEQMYDYAVQLIKAGKAYVDDSSADEIREQPRHSH